MSKKLVAEIPADLGKIRTTFAFSLTLRQMIFFLIGGIFGFASYWLLSKYVDKDLALYVMILIAVPSFAFGIYEKDGFKLEQYIKFFYENQIQRKQVRHYSYKSTQEEGKKNEFSRKSVSHQGTKKGGGKTKTPTPNNRTRNNTIRKDVP